MPPSWLGDLLANVRWNWSSSRLRQSLWYFINFAFDFGCEDAHQGEPSDSVLLMHLWDSRRNNPRYAFCWQMTSLMVLLGHGPHGSEVPFDVGIRAISTEVRLLLMTREALMRRRYVAMTLVATESATSRSSNSRIPISQESGLSLLICHFPSMSNRYRGKV